MQDEYLTCVSYMMNCKLSLSHLLHYEGVLVLEVRINYYKYVIRTLQVRWCPLSHHINMCGLLSEETF